MSSVPMPRDLSEEAVAEWLFDAYRGRLPDTGAYQSVQWDPVARAVRALVEREVAKERASTREKVREAVVFAQCGLDDEGRAIVARVMGDHPSNASGGHEAEGREVPRG